MTFDGNDFLWKRIDVFSYTLMPALSRVADKNLS